ncbi:T9SS type A sorting domain-containing protein [bacterium]|nr:T9SS type A sorting domain-containing protein [bacterium]
MRKIATWLFCALLITAISDVGSATQVLGGQAGNADDTSDATYHFDSQNEDFQITMPDGTSLTNADIPYHYGTDFKILQNNKDLIAEKNLAVEGGNLTSSNLSNDNYPLANTVAIDPALGLIKFSPVGTWSGAERKDNGAQMPTDTPTLALNNNGEAFLAFWQPDAFSGLPFIWARRYTQQNGWYNPVSFTVATDATNPRIVMNDSGQAICIYHTNNDIYANWYVPGTGWYGSVTLQANNNNVIGIPVVDLNANGQAVMIFAQTTGSYDILYARRFNFNNQYWSDPVQIDVTGYSTYRNYSVDINNTGRIAAAFRQDMGSPDYRIYVAQYNGSSWLTPDRIDPEFSTDDDDMPSVSINDSNRVLVTYLHSLPGTDRVFAREYDPTTTWYDNVTISAHSTIESARNPQSKMDNNNQGFCVFEQDVDGTSTIQAARFQSGTGTGWDQAVTISPNVAANAESASLDINDNGHAMVAFAIQGASTSDIYYNTYNPHTGGWQDIVEYEGLLNSKIGDLQNTYIPVASINNQGKAMVAFLQDTLTSSQIHLNMFDNAVPTGTLEVNYYKTDPTPTATPATTVNEASIVNRKLLPGSGESSTINYSTTKAGLITIKVYNLKGKLVKTLVEGYHQAGTYSITWAAQNVNGNLVASGIYIVHIKTPKITKTLKIAVVK